MPERLRRSAGLGGLVVLSVAVALLLGEIALRIVLPSPDGYYLYPPGLRRAFEPREEVMPGVHGVSRFLVNSQGLRADELEPEHRYRILAIGGSTTQCLYLDQSEAWPNRLQDLLTERWAGGRVWVGNAGKAGRRLAEHRLQLEHLLPAIPKLDAVVLLLGANDVNRRLSEDAAYRPPDLDDPAVREELLARAFEVYPRAYALLPLRRTALGTLLHRVRALVRTRRHWQMIQDTGGRNYQLWRELRARASEVRDQLPDLGSALRAYESDLEAVRSLTRDRSVRAIFMTQPFVYRDDLPEEHARLLWMGWVGERQTDPGQPYYSVGALARAYAAFNRTLLDFCRKSGAECIDLEPQLPKDTRSFYDDIHFNESGSDRVARLLAEHLVARPPFGNRTLRSDSRGEAPSPGPVGSPGPRAGTASTGPP